MTSFAFGHALRMTDKEERKYNFQNFFIGKQITHKGSSYRFVPFGFSGVTVNRTGDGLEAALAFPNNSLARNWGVGAIEEAWIIEVDVLMIEDPDPDTGLSTANKVVHTYTGQVTGGQWDNTSLNLELSSVLDAVGTDVPRRALTNRIVGNLPTSSNVRLR
ncbi:putative phage minor tail protein [uncultured Mediterranean phage uvMED]|nr:putative phage minor tail protein [uncultured Mediterranean phage uvMED]